MDGKTQSRLSRRRFPAVAGAAVAAGMTAGPAAAGRVLVTGGQDGVLRGVAA